MSVNYPRIVDVDLERSSYDTHSGNFIFVLDKQIEHRWRDEFFDAIRLENATCFAYRQPTIASDTSISAYAEIDGEYDLRAVHHHLKRAIVVANASLKDKVDAEIAEEAKRQKAKRELDHRLKTIVGSLRFE